MCDQTSVTPGMAWAVGLVCLAFASLPMLHATGHLAAGPNGPAWLLIPAGIMFAASGMAVIIRYSFSARRNSRVRSVAQYLLSLAIIGSMTVMVAWVAFGPGPRQFGTNIPFVPVRLIEPLGRAAFGISTLLMAGIFLVFALAGAIRLRSNRSTDR